MTSIRRKLEKKGVIAMTLLTVVLIGTGCEDRIDNPVINPSRRKMVEVSLNIGFANEVDAATRSTDTKAPNNSDGNKQSAFDMQLVPTSQTRAAAMATTVHPDKLYNLEIHQYGSGGTHLKSVTVGTIDPGAAITQTLNDNGGTECSLLIIARGDAGTVASLSGNPLSKVNAVTADKTKLESVNASTGDKINDMPYLLYLPKVKIVSGKLVSPEGTDIRLLLKRLAVGVSIDWTFGENMKENYTLSEVRLMQVPKDYRILPETEPDKIFGTTYPTSVSEFVDGFRLKGENLNNISSQTFWMPANARGIRNDVTYPTYRNKDYAHSAATYVEFVVNNKNEKERLLYRAYLGGNTTNDFNLLENTNYHWTINITAANYTTDPRIQLQDLSPVISTNLQTTSNCFMMLPGTNICFNPYKHEAGTSGWNTELTTNGTAIQDGKTIDRVEILWQTKDAGTSGDLVMGYVADDTNHQNLVNLTEGDDINNARIHVKVPITCGGNAVIAAKNSSGTIVWSWHLWISDYVPVGLTGDITSVNRNAAIQTAQNATKGGMVQVYGGISWTDPDGAFYKCVIMDRHLGAIRAGIQDNLLDGVRTFGLLYQAGRKDPFFSTADGSNEEKNTIYDGNGEEVSIVKPNSGTSYTALQMIQNPLTFVTNTNSFNSIANAWNGDKSKTVYDPCPKGWRVPSDEYLNNAESSGGTAGVNEKHYDGDSKSSLFAGFGYNDKPSYVANHMLYNTEEDKDKDIGNMRYYDGKEILDIRENKNSSTVAGSGYIYFGGSGENEENYSNKSAFFPGVSCRESSTGKYRKTGENNVMYLWTSTKNNYLSGTRQHLLTFQTEGAGGTGKIRLWFQVRDNPSYGFSVRCIQDNIRDRSIDDYKNGN